MIWGSMQKHMVSAGIPAGANAPKLDFDVFSTGSHPCIQNIFCFRWSRTEKANNQKSKGAASIFNGMMTTVSQKVLQIDRSGR